MEKLLGLITLSPENDHIFHGFYQIKVLPSFCEKSFEITLCTQCVFNDLYTRYAELVNCVTEPHYIKCVSIWRGEGVLLAVGQATGRVSLISLRKQFLFVNY